MTFSPFSVTPSDYFSNQGIAVGESSTPRIGIGSSAALVSQQVQFTYWTAQKTEVCNNIVMVTNNTAAAATPTYCAIGFYSAASDGSVTLLSQCANDTTLFAATFTTYTRSLISSVTKIAGTRYATAVLVVSAVALPTFYGYNGNIIQANVAPRISAIQTGQSVLPASVAAGSLANTNQMHFAEVTP